MIMNIYFWFYTKIGIVLDSTYQLIFKKPYKWIFCIVKLKSIKLYSRLNDSFWSFGKIVSLSYAELPKIDMFYDALYKNYSFLI